MSRLVLWLLLVATGGAAGLDEVVETYPDGSLHRRYSVDGEGQRHGAFVEYHPNGKLAIRARYRRGAPNGTFERYHENGRRALRASYRDGVLEGKYEERWPDGSPHVEGRYRRGLRHGEFEIQRARELQSVQEWEDGRLLEINGIEPYPRERATLLETLDAIEAVPETETDGEAAGGDPLDPERRAALRRLQAYRYLCAVPHEGMELDERFNAHASAAAALLKRIGRLDHNPPNPGLPRKEYEFALKGTQSSNLSLGPELPGSIDSYMDDSDPSNIDRVGHRRWCLNPPMAKTGFGRSGRYSAMWSFDASRAVVPDYDATLYPPRGYVPVSYFGRRHAWSARLNPSHFGRPRIAELEIAVHRLDDWYAPSGEPFELDYRGVSGSTVIFRPADLELEPGARYWVEIRGLEPKGKRGDDRLAYLVEFVEG